MNQQDHPKHKISIAIADDHTIFRNGLCGVINSFKDLSVVLEASNGLDLLSKLSEQEVLPDLCILDINMPVMNGYDALASMKIKWPDIKVIVLSMLDDEYAVLRMLKMGANGFLLKDCNPKEFHGAIIEVHNGGFYFSGLISDEIIQNAAQLIIPSISERQIEFLTLCITDLNYLAIAKEMGITVRAVESIQQRLSEKLQINTRIGLALFAIRTGLINRMG